MNNRDDDEDELPLGEGLKRIDAVSAYPATLAEAFKQGFTVPEALRMNSVYGKYGSEAERRTNMPAVGLTILALAVHRARRVMRVV